MLSQDPTSLLVKIRLIAYHGTISGYHIVFSNCQSVCFYAAGTACSALTANLCPFCTSAQSWQSVDPADLEEDRFDLDFELNALRSLPFPPPATLSSSFFCPTGGLKGSLLRYLFEEAFLRSPTFEFDSACGSCCFFVSKGCFFMSTTWICDSFFICDISGCRSWSCSCC